MKYHSIAAAIAASSIVAFASHAGQVIQDDFNGTGSVPTGWIALAGTGTVSETGGVLTITEPVDEFTAIASSTTFDPTGLQITATVQIASMAPESEAIIALSSPTIDRVVAINIATDGWMLMTTGTNGEPSFQDFPPLQIPGFSGGPVEVTVVFGQDAMTIRTDSGYASGPLRYEETMFDFQTLNDLGTSVHVVLGCGSEEPDGGSIDFDSVVVDSVAAPAVCLPPATVELKDSFTGVSGPLPGTWTKEFGTGTATIVNDALVLTDNSIDDATAIFSVASFDPQAGPIHLQLVAAPPVGSNEVEILFVASDFSALLGVRIEGNGGLTLAYDPSLDTEPETEIQVFSGIIPFDLTMDIHLILEQQTLRFFELSSGTDLGALTLDTIFGGLPVNALGNDVNAVLVSAGATSSFVVDRIKVTSRSAAYPDGGQVGYFELLKGKLFQQVADNAVPAVPSLVGMESTIVFFDAADATSVTFNGTDPLSQSGSEWELSPVFATLAELEAAYPDDTTHTLCVSGGLAGSRSQEIALGAPAYPDAPFFTGDTFSRLAAFNPDEPFVLNWNSPDAAGATGAAVYIFIDGLDSDLFDSGLLLANETTATVPSGTLTAGTDYIVEIEFFASRETLADPFPGFASGDQIDPFIGTVLYSTFTEVEFTPIVPAACACNWNDDATLNSDDFFAFLNDFFAGSADFDNDGVTNSNDFFAFLGCFFTPPAGC